MIRVPLTALATLIATPAIAQHHHMPGMAMPAPTATPRPKAKASPPTRPKARPAARAASRPSPAPPRPKRPTGQAPSQGTSGHADHGAPAAGPTEPHAGHSAADMAAATIDQRAGGAQDPGSASHDAHSGTMQHGTGGTALPPGDAPTPSRMTANYADRIWGADVMASSRTRLAREHGGSTFSQVMLNIAEVRFARGRDGYHWDGEGWFGGDINRLTVKSEGEGSFGRSDGRGEVQALYSRAIGPYFDVQAGVRQDFGTGPSRTYASLGLEGLAPYWFDVETTLFLSDRGDLTARAEGYYDQRITQRLIAQPRVEFDLAAQDVPELGIGSGLVSTEIGLRLRYEIVREFAPYIGIVHERRFGSSARLARAAGDDAAGTGVVAGVRFWF